MGVQDTCRCRPLTVVTYRLLLIPPCFANTFFNICFCIILNTYFLTDCLTTIYYIITFILPRYMSFLFYSPTCLSQARRGEGVIQDSHLGLPRFPIDRSNSITEY